MACHQSRVVSVSTALGFVVSMGRVYIGFRVDVTAGVTVQE